MRFQSETYVFRFLRQSVDWAWVSIGTKENLDTLPFRQCSVFIDPLCEEYGYDLDQSTFLKLTGKPPEADRRKWNVHLYIASENEIQKRKREHY